MISGAALMSLLVAVIIGGLIFYVLWWLLGILALPEPFDKVARVIIALVAVIFLIGVLMDVSGHPLVRW